MRSRFAALSLLLALVATACTALPSTATLGAGETQGSIQATTQVSEVTKEYTYSGAQAAPDFPKGLDWLNIDRPLSISRDLRGKIVLLDFWTQGCINCLHIFPELKRLEAEHPDSLVVIGVHSAKFEAEGQLESIRQAVLRYGLKHPVVNDVDFQIWQQFGVGAWPTLVLIDPVGNVVGYHMGEGVYEVFKPIIAVMEDEYRRYGELDTRPLNVKLESETAISSALSFPGAVLADEAGQRLFIADSNHHRILVSDFEGQLQMVIGAGVSGFVDGDFISARFNRPQGMALSPDGNILYVADLENHAVRAIDLIEHEVTTIAGDGELARFYPSGNPALETSLNSPWDVLLYDGKLYIAMAGMHQIWVLNLEDNSIAVFAGSGQEGLEDGAPQTATLAQPSGLATDGEYLYFTDPEASAVRRVPLDGSGELTTIVGADLFTFGDQDGPFSETQLQHALGITYYQGDLYLADTYNYKIKVLDLEAQTSTTWLGNGEMGYANGAAEAAQFAEPSSISIADGRAFIADTNNHLIRVADLATGEVSVLSLSNLGIALRPETPGVGVEQITLNPRIVKFGVGTLEFTFYLPVGYRFNDAGPLTLTWSTSDKDVVNPTSWGETSYQSVNPEFPIVFPVVFGPKHSTTIRAEVTAFYCQTDADELCLVHEVVLLIPVTVGSEGTKTSISASYVLPGISE